MSDYISRDEIFSVWRSMPKPASISSLTDAINQTPAADVEPVRHGRWVDYMVRDWRCSECGQKIIKVRNVDGYCYNDKPNYCPNCGAKMDLEEENNDD